MDDTATTTGSGCGDVQAVVDWLIGGARTVRQPQEVLAELCARLVACGLPLHRVAVFVRTLHPDVMGRRFLWRPGEDVLVTEAGYGVLERDTYRMSPVRSVFETGHAVRRRIEDQEPSSDHGVIGEFRAEGVTDYLAQPLTFTNGEVHAVSWTTTRPGGFSNDEIAALEAIRLPFSRLAEVYALRRLATTLLNTYVGRGAASASSRDASGAATPSASTR